MEENSRKGTKGRKKEKKKEEGVGGLVEEEDPKVEPYHLVFQSGNHNVVDGYRFQAPGSHLFFIFIFIFVVIVFIIFLFFYFLIFFSFSSPLFLKKNFRKRSKKKASPVQW